MYKVKINELDKVSLLYARAFQDDPLYVNLINNSKKREHFLKEFFEFRVKFLFEKGYIYALDENIDCVMAYTEPETHMTPKDLIKYGGLKAILKLGPKTAKKFMKFNDCMTEAENNINIENMYSIGPLATAPEEQGKGKGKVMFKFISKNIIGEECMQILHTQNILNCKMYEEFGFNKIEETKLDFLNISSYTYVNK